MKKYIIPILIIFISGCASNEIGHSKDVNQDEINQGYRISYDETLGHTDITAFFRFAGPNGTTLILDSPSSIELNGESFTENPSSGVGCFYNKVVKGQLPDNTYVFTFSDMNGKKFENKLNFRNMQVEEIPKQISKNDGLTIHFTDKPEGRGEDVDVEITDDSISVSESYKHVFLERIRFPKEKLDRLHGTAKIKIRRYGSFELKQHAHAGGFITTDYALAPKEVVISE